MSKSTSTRLFTVPYTCKKQHKKMKLNDKRDKDLQHKMYSEPINNRSFLANLVRQHARNEFRTTVPSFLDLWLHMINVILVYGILIIFITVFVSSAILYGPQLYYKYPIIGSIVLGFVSLITVSYLFACEAAKELKIKF